MEIKVYIKNPGKKGFTKSIENSLASFQNVVGGLIEGCFVTERLQANGIGCYGNDEGKLIGLRPNIWSEGKLDYLVGTLVFFADDGEGGETSLNSEQIAIIEEEIEKAEISFTDMIRILQIL